MNGLDLPTSIAAFFLTLGLVLGCGETPRARSELSFDQIATRVAGLSAAETARALGEPDSRQRVFLRDERWIWWNYTFLDGDDYPPEIRGQVVHLEITFRKPLSAGGDRTSYSQWRVAEPYGVSYLTPLNAPPPRGGTSGARGRTP